MNVKLKNIETGEIKEVRVNGSLYLCWTCLWFGIPLFQQKLYKLGAIMVALWLVIMGSLMVSGGDNIIGTFGGFIYVGFAIYFGINSPKIAIKNYLQNGWAFNDPNSDVSKAVKLRLGV